MSAPSTPGSGGDARRDVPDLRSLNESLQQALHLLQTAFADAEALEEAQHEAESAQHAAAYSNMETERAAVEATRAEQAAAEAMRRASELRSLATQRAAEHEHEVQRASQRLHELGERQRRMDATMAAVRSAYDAAGILLRPDPSSGVRTPTNGVAVSTPDRTQGSSSILSALARGFAHHALGGEGSGALSMIMRPLRPSASTTPSGSRIQPAPPMEQTRSGGGQGSLYPPISRASSGPASLGIALTGPSSPRRLMLMSPPGRSTTSSAAILGSPTAPSSLRQRTPASSGPAAKDMAVVTSTTTSTETIVRTGAGARTASASESSTSVPSEEDVPLPSSSTPVASPAVPTTTRSGRPLVHQGVQVPSHRLTRAQILRDYTRGGPLRRLPISHFPPSTSRPGRQASTLASTSSPSQQSRHAKRGRSVEAEAENQAPEQADQEEEDGESKGKGKTREARSTPSGSVAAASSESPPHKKHRVDGEEGADDDDEEQEEEEKGEVRSSSQASAQQGAGPSSQPSTDRGATAQSAATGPPPRGSQQSSRQRGRTHAEQGADQQQPQQERSSQGQTTRGQHQGGQRHHDGNGANGGGGQGGAAAGTGAGQGRSYQFTFTAPSSFGARSMSLPPMGPMMDWQHLPPCSPSSAGDGTVGSDAGGFDSPPTSHYPLASSSPFGLQGLGQIGDGAEGAAAVLMSARASVPPSSKAIRYYPPSPSRTAHQRGHGVGRSSSGGGGSAGKTCARCGTRDAAAWRHPPIRMTVPLPEPASAAPTTAAGQGKEANSSPATSVTAAGAEPAPASPKKILVVDEDELRAAEGGVAPLMGPHLNAQDTSVVLVHGRGDSIDEDGAVAPRASDQAQGGAHQDPHGHAHASSSSPPRQGSSATGRPWICSACYQQARKSLAAAARAQLALRESVAHVEPRGGSSSTGADVRTHPNADSAQDAQKEGDMAVRDEDGDDEEQPGSDSDTLPTPSG